MGLLDHTVVLFLIFWGTLILFSMLAVPICIPTNSGQGFPFPTSFPTLTFCLFDNGCSNRFGVISHCGFGLYFPDDQQHWASFRVPVGHLHFLLEKMAVQSFCVASLYIFQKSEVFNLFCFWEKEMTGGTSCEFKSMCFSISAEPLVSYLTSVSLATWALPC